MQRIINTFQSWELFSHTQIQDTISALEMMQRNFIFYNSQDQKPIIRQLIQLLDISDLAINIRLNVCINVFILMRNNLMNLFLIDPFEAHLTL